MTLIAGQERVMTSEVWERM